MRHTEDEDELDVEDEIEGRVGGAEEPLLEVALDQDVLCTRGHKRGGHKHRERKEGRGWQAR